jgi:WD40 repeat protein/GNAT superfamily N-acetyltransferase
MFVDRIQSTERAFYAVGGKYPGKMPVLREIFNRILEPLYGSQKKALQQIQESKDRKCFLLYEGENAVGVLAFKTILSDEFKYLGIEKSIEVKSLFVDQSKHNSGRGLGSALVDKLKEEVQKLGLPYEGIHVTVSETKEESLTFFKKKGFTIAHEWKGRYQPNVIEFLLSCPRKVVEGNAALAPRMGREENIPELLHIIHDAHSDDIHCLKMLSDGTFISGSKDNCIYKWDATGNRVKIVDEVEPTVQSDRNWITAIEVINDEYWVSGSRDGEVVLWKTNGDYVRQIKGKIPSKNQGHHSHPYNLKRVMCFAAGSNRNKPTLFTGFPTMFSQYNFIEGRTESFPRVHTNDWVYVIKPLAEDKVLAVVGDAIETWTRKDDEWTFGKQVFKENNRYKTSVNGKPKLQRAFIADLCALNPQNTQFAFGSFDKSVQVLDLEKPAITNKWTEHNGRVWKIEKLSEQIFASGSEDGLVKLWDVRQDKSTKTVNASSGEVTALLSLKDNVLLTGTCPKSDNSHNKSAQIRFFDVRK